MALNKKDLVFGILYIVLAKQFHLWLTNKGVGVQFINHYPGNCRIVPGIQCGSEKISVTKNGLAFITNGLRMSNCNPDFLKGKIYLFDFGFPDRNVKELAMKNVSDEFIHSLDPHGMDIFIDRGTNVFKLFVVNHANKKDSIEIFHYSKQNPTEITHVSTITNENFVCLNDITVIDNEEFYVTNFNKFCHSSYSDLLVPVELIFGLSTANIVYFKKGFSAIAAYGALLNGIAVSNDKNYVYVVSSATSSVTAYKRHNGGKLQHFKQIYVGYFPDNVHVENETGDLYVGQGKDFFGYSKLIVNQTNYVSSAVVKIKSPLEKQTKVTEILHDDGKNFIHSISTPVRFNNQFLLGTVSHKLAYCDARKYVKVVLNSEKKI